ncbi:MAG: peptide deformylase [Oscillospiraceae bacterium]|jgi:peptide deformylase|nr:peptide deformylase [Oscillospiraceae bacterium]
MEILVEGDIILESVSRRVENYGQELCDLLENLRDTVKDAGGIGIAAPQVGILLRVVVVCVDEKEIIEMVNPEIVETSGVQRMREGCLSCPDFLAVTRRPEKVKVEAYDRNGKKFKINASGLKACAICHEIDHLDGVLFKSRLDASELFRTLKFGKFLW